MRVPEDADKIPTKPLGEKIVPEKPAISPRAPRANETVFVDENGKMQTNLPLPKARFTDILYPDL